MEVLPTRILPAGARSLAAVQTSVPEELREAFDGGKLTFFNALAKLRCRSAFDAYLKPVADAEWVVYAEPPFGGPERVLEYLGRYTHRVALANSRLIDFSDGQVAFRWKDSRRDSRHGVMHLEAMEFVRRFLLHVLPVGFQRIRHYGLLANRTRAAKLTRCRELLAVPVPEPTVVDGDYRDRYECLTGLSLRSCPM